MKKLYNIFLIIILFVFSTYNIIAQTSTIYINTTKDCYTWSQQPNTNQNNNYLVAEHNSGTDEISLIYFNLSSIPPNATILHAYLLLYRFDDLSNITLRFARLDLPSWGETTVTWNNMPPPTTPPAYKYFNLGPPNSYSAYDVTESAQAWHSGGYIYNGFQVWTETDGTGAIFYARENGSSTIPKLEVIYQLPVPNPPTLISPSNGATNIPTNPTTFSWNASTGADSYELQVATNSGFTNIIYDQTGVTSTSKQVNGLNNGITYYWRVNATNGGGTSDWSNVWHFTTIQAIPQPPTLLSPPNGSTGISISPTLSWNASSGANSYRCQVSTSSTFNNTLFDQSGITGTSIQVNGLQNGTFYYWRVNATNEGGTSDWSSTWNFTTSLNPPPPPVFLTPADGATGVLTSPTLSWNASSGADSYRCQVSTSSSFTTTVFDQSGITATSIQVIGLQNETLYYWRVNATNEGGTSSWPSPWNFTTIVAPPAKPSLSSPSNGSTGISLEPTLVWNTSNGANSYRCQVSTSSTFTTTIFDQNGITATSIQITNGLQNNTTYYWHVSATNEGGNSDYSDTWNFTTESPSNVEQIGSSIPTQYELLQNYPNPFNPTTKIGFSIPQSSFVTLIIYDVVGHEVRILVNQNLSAGNYGVEFIANNIPSGIYFYRIEARSVDINKKFIKVGKMILLK